MHATVTQDVMVVEDDAVVREALVEALSDEGYRVAEASDGQEALSHLAAGARPCVMLLDLMMPVMNGWQLLEQMRQDEQLARIPVVVVSASRDPDEPAGAVRYLSKPIDLTQLLQEVAERCPSGPDCASPEQPN